MKSWYFYSILTKISTFIPVQEHKQAAMFSTEQEKFRVMSYFSNEWGTVVTSYPMAVPHYVLPLPFMSEC